MKVFYMISATIIVVCIAFILYTRYDAKIFRESLPKTPEEISKEGTRDDVQPQTVTEQGLTKQTESTDIQHESIESETSEAADVPENENDQGKNNISPAQGGTVVNNPQMVEIPKRKLRYSELKTDQKIAKLRRWLVENHDNKAEIEKYLTLERMYIQSMVYLPNNLAVLDMHIDDQVRRAELLVKLYPNNGNEGFLRRTLEIKAKIEAGEYIPMYEFPREYWHEVSQ